MQLPHFGGSPESADPVLLEVRTRFVDGFRDCCDTAAGLIARSAGLDTRESAHSLRALAHRLAGLAGVIGFPRVSALASDLEDAACQLELGASDPRPAQQLVDSLRTAFALELSGLPPSWSQPTSRSDWGPVLVVDDDNDQRAILKQQLSDAGFRAEGVASGDLVLSAARALLPSVILLDVELPGSNGYAVCRALKADADLGTVPIIFVTARNRVDDRVVGLTLGADDYLVKPVDPRELVIRLERVRMRQTSQPEVDPADGIPSYGAFLRVARSKLDGSASVALLRVPAGGMTQAVLTVMGEIPSSALLCAYDRRHLLVLLARTSGSAAQTWAADIIRRLAESNIADVTAGVACTPPKGSLSIEALVSNADEALMCARNAARKVAVYGEQSERRVEPSRAAILIADDDPDVMRIVDAQLRRAGLETRLAFDGAETMAALERSVPDVLILDLMMPKLNGFDLLARLHQSSARRPKIVVLSARGREEDVLRAFQLGADDYVTKPFNPQELVARVARLVR